MHLTKVEMGFCIDDGHTEVVLFIPIGFEVPAPVGWCHALVALGSLMS